MFSIINRILKKFKFFILKISLTVHGFKLEYNVSISKRGFIFIMKRIFILITILFMGVSGYAQDFSTFKLNDGQTVIIKEVHDNPIVIIDTWIKTGSINETDQNSGVAHFLEHLFFKGTTKHPTNEFDKILESKGAITNAATSKDYTHYYVLLPSKDVELAMELHADMLLHPLIPRKELEKERKVVLEEIAKDNDEPSNILYKNMNSILYKEHPYKREVIGKKEIIETIPREQILSFYDKWYNPQNMVTIIVGDINTDKALELVEKNFKPKNVQCAQKTPITKYKMDKKPIKQTQIKKALKVETGYMMIGFKGCENASVKDSYTLDLLATILGDGKSSRLYRDIKEQKQLVSSIGAGHSSFKDNSIFYVNANYAPENVDKVKKEIFYEINKIKQEKINADEINKAKNIIERDTYYSRESISNIANEIGYSMILTDNPKYYSEYIANMKKVTAKDLQEAAKKYLDLNSAAISIVTPEETKEVKAQIKENKNCTAKVESKNKTITKYILPNKATLLINQNNANNIIAIDIYNKGGNFVEKIPGIGVVTAESMLKGTKKYPEQELTQILDESGIIIAPQPSSDTFKLSVKFTKNEEKQAMDILNEVVNNANLDAYGLEKIKSDRLYSIKKSRDNPQSVAFEEFKTSIWENTPYGYTGKILENTIPKIQRDDVVDFYQNVFSPQNMVISINGNVNEQEMIDYFTNLFEEKNTKIIDVTKYKDQFKPLNCNKVVKVAKNTETSWIVMGWQTDGIQNQKDWVTLQIIDSILGSGMSSRLFVDLRDQQGLAYQIGSSFSANMNKGVFAVYIGTNPQTATLSKNELLREINKMKKEFISDKELSQAKEKLIGNYVISLETNMEKASTLGWLEASSRGYDFMDKYPEMIESVTVQDVITTANKYFSKPYVLSVVGPKENIENF